MPTIAGHGSPPFAAGIESKDLFASKVQKSGEIQSDVISTPQKRRLRSNSTVEDGPVSMTLTPKSLSPVKWKSPRRSVNQSPSSLAKRIIVDSDDKMAQMSKSPRKKLADIFLDKPMWNPRDVEQMTAVKEALHVSTVPSAIVCREEEQKRVLEFCQQCLEQEKAGSLYVCGCPGTGKSLSMDKVKERLIVWAKEAGYRPPDVLAINCTSLSSSSDIFSKILGSKQPQKKSNRPTSSLQHLQNMNSQKQQSTDTKMKLIIADEMDYLITKDRAVLHDLFMLTTSPYSKCILIGVANAIDLADRFLPRLRSLNCKPMVVTFRAYSTDQIIKILQGRLMVLPYVIFQPQALELCARKVAAASGDMRKALCVCRSAIEMLEAEVRESNSTFNLSSMEKSFSDQQPPVARKREFNVDIQTGTIIGRGTEQDGVYYINEVVHSGTAALAHGTTERQAWLWHRRLGHPSFGYLKRLFKRW